MEVLDRYLEAVRGYLPRDQRADIVGELADDLRSEIEDRQAGVGRPLSEDEVAALLKRRGHPMTVAERYLPLQYLIGPAMLPVYRRTVAIVVSVLLAIAVSLYAVFSGPARGAVPALRSGWAWFWLAGLAAFAYVGLFTVIFSLIEWHHRRAHVTGAWDPRDPDGLTGTDPETAARRSARAYAAVEVVSDLLALYFWLGAHSVNVPAVGLVLTPAWYALHWPVAAYLVTSIVANLADALRPSASRARLLVHLGVNAFALVLTVWLLLSAPWVRIVAAGIPAPRAATVERWLNAGGLVTLLFFGVFYLARVVRLALRASEAPAGRSQAPLAAGR